MNISGLLVTLESVDGYVLCHFGNYEDGDVKLKAKFWTSSVPMEKVIHYCGSLLRPVVKGSGINEKEIIVDVKDFSVYGDVVDDMVISSFIGCHGEVLAGDLLKSQTWHGKDLKMCGDFITHFKARHKDPVCIV